MVSRKERLAFCFNLISKEFKKSMSCCNELSKNFSIKDISLIQLLGESPKMMSELSVELNLTPGSMTTKIDNLISKKLVERVYDSEDRRKVYIKLTKKSEKIYQSILNQSLDMSESLLKDLSSEEQEQYVKLSEKVASKFIGK